MLSRDVVCLRYISINTPHKGGGGDDDDDDDDASFCLPIALTAMMSHCVT